MDTITSTNNRRVKQLRALLLRNHERKSTGLFVAEGLRLVSELSPDMIQELYVSESFQGSPGFEEVRSFSADKLCVLSDSVFRSVSDTQNPQGIMAVVRQFTYSEKMLEGVEDPLLLILENIQDPGNLGTMIRTAEGAGISAIILNSACAEVYNPKTVRSSMGSLLRVPFIYTDDIKGAVDIAEGCGAITYAACPQRSRLYTEPDYRKAGAFMIGNEGSGLSDEAIALAKERIYIPMSGKLESLNAATSAAILMYEAKRQRS